jgi:hypothetical protein
MLNPFINSAKLSQAEKQFVKHYISALRRDFDKLRTAMCLSDPDIFGVVDIVKAAEMATEISDFGAEFETSVGQLVAKNRHHVRRIPAWPPIEAMSDLFCQSFYKTMTTLKQDKLKLFPKIGGLYSGNPEDSWQHTVDMVKKFSDPKPLSGPEKEETHDQDESSDDNF